ncbi:MAG TPA: nucleotidyltransferase domain-containing protein [Opitutaceae bacterium]
MLDDDRVIRQAGTMQEYLLLPVGTRVVTREPMECFDSGGGPKMLKPVGSVGVIEKIPTDGVHPYVVRFPDGRHAAIKRPQLTILKQVHGDELAEAAAALSSHDLAEFVIYRCVVGSRAFGLAGEESDTDVRGIYLPPAEVEWSLYGAPEQLESADDEECFWELKKFLVMALKANPNVLECLYTPLVLDAKPLAQELRSLRSIFLSKLVYKTFNGYVLSQFKKLEQGIRASGEIRWKHAMHLIRLVLSGIRVLQNGELPIDVGEHRESLMAIKRGERSWADVNAWRLQLHAEFEAAFVATRLPERPDYAAANDFLIRARQSMIQSS